MPNYPSGGMPISPETIRAITNKFAALETDGGPWSVCGLVLRLADTGVPLEIIADAQVSAVSTYNPEEISILRPFK